MPEQVAMRDYSVRLATSADVPMIHALYRGLSPESSRARFSVNMTDAALLDAATLPDKGITVVACRDRDIVGEARVAAWGGVHEFALTVSDEHQGHGVGVLLVSRLRLAARERGLTSLRAVIEADNVRMVSIVKKLGMAVVTPPNGGQLVVDIASDSFMPDWADSDGSPRVLIESPTLAESKEAADLRRAGFDVRVCLGPVEGEHACPVLEFGRCRLADQADFIATLLPDELGVSSRIADAHSRGRSRLPTAQSLPEWQRAVKRMIDEKDSVRPDPE